MTEKPIPITVSSVGRLHACVEALTGRRLCCVSYRMLPFVDGDGVWPTENSSGAVDEVDMCVVLSFDDGSFISISWAMDGFTHGIDVRAERVGKFPIEVETEVGPISEWKRLIGEVVEEVGAAWHVSHQGCPDALWALRLSFTLGSVVIAIGEVEEGAVRGTANALVVIFDDATARAYRWASCRQSSYGERIS